jgi:hypothetical protein
MTLIFTAQSHHVEVIGYVVNRTWGSEIVEGKVIAM